MGKKKDRKGNKRTKSVKDWFWTGLFEEVWWVDEWMGGCKSNAKRLFTPIKSVYGENRIKSINNNN